MKINKQKYSVDIKKIKILRQKDTLSEILVTKKTNKWNNKSISEHKSKHVFLS